MAALIGLDPNRKPYHNPSTNDAKQRGLALAMMHAASPLCYSFFYLTNR